jgi:hypothetical protein
MIAPGNDAVPSLIRGFLLLLARRLRGKQKFLMVAGFGAQGGCTKYREIPAAKRPDDGWVKV